MTLTYEAISSQTLTSAQATVTFSSIPSTYTDLVLIANVQHSVGSGNYLRINGDTGNNYSITWIAGHSGGAVSSRNSNQNLIDIGAHYAAAPTSGSFAILQVNFMNYSNTTTNKTMLARYNDAAGSDVEANVSLYRSTSAISSFALTNNGNFNAGCTFSLYGIKAE